MYFCVIRWLAMYSASTLYAQLTLWSGCIRRTEFASVHVNKNRNMILPIEALRTLNRGKINAVFKRDRPT